MTITTTTTSTSTSTSTSAINLMNQDNNDLNSIYEKYQLDIHSEEESDNEDISHDTNLTFFKNLKRRVSHGTINFKPIASTNKLNFNLSTALFNKGRRNSSTSITTVSSSSTTSKMASPLLLNNELNHHKLGYYQRKNSHNTDFDHILLNGFSTEDNLGKDYTLSLTLTPDLIR